jgi:hypothetical protein
VTQDAAIVLCLKIVFIAGFASLAAWVAVYDALTRGGWRRSPIGRTLVVEALLIAALFVPTALSLFFHLNRFDSLVAGWADVALIGLVAPAMIWRIAVWVRLGRLGRLPRTGHGGEDSDGTG